LKRPISVVITDLDNTLFDWVADWHRSFAPLLKSLVKLSSIPQVKLEAEIRSIHQKYGTSEYAFLLEELPSLRARHSGASKLDGAYDPAIDAYRAAREQVSDLYPTVAESLRVMKRQGAVVVSYTESLAFYTDYRIHSLGLDGLLDYVYSPPDHDLPIGLTPKTILKYYPKTPELRHTLHMHTAQGVTKPDQRIIEEIVHEVGGSIGATVFVGDSLMKDMAMANEAGVFSALAEYGAAHQRSEYELLRRVSHWTDHEVSKEREILENPPIQVEPTVRLKRRFGELLEHFEFAPGRATERR